MIDVFISYAREDIAHAAELAGLLEKNGYSVWWDRQLIGGANYREVIDGKIREANKVIVLWSRNSVVSSFVRDEANEASEQMKLIPIVIDDSRPPLGFREIHTLYVNKFEHLVDVIIASIEQKFSPSLRREAYGRERYNKIYATIAMCSIGVVLAVFSFFVYGRRGGNENNIQDFRYKLFKSDSIGIIITYPINIFGYSDLAVESRFSGSLNEIS